MANHNCQELFPRKDTQDSASSCQPSVNSLKHFLKRLTFSPEVFVFSFAFAFILTKLINFHFIREFSFTMAFISCLFWILGCLVWHIWWFGCSFMTRFLVGILRWFDTQETLWWYFSLRFDTVILMRYDTIHFTLQFERRWNEKSTCEVCCRVKTEEDLVSTLSRKYVRMSLDLLQNLVCISYPAHLFKKGLSFAAEMPTSLQTTRRDEGMMTKLSENTLWLDFANPVYVACDSLSTVSSQVVTQVVMTVDVSVLKSRFMYLKEKETINSYFIWFCCL